MDNTREEPVNDICYCSSCHWQGKVSDCEAVWEDEGYWGSPSHSGYWVHLCPKCEDGGEILDYFPSSEVID